ncbi:MAG: metallophosphoesterase [Lachnospiraceae bacterium]|nr:metallophosphoesterase [Lachnospiraceae bacterium]
MNLYIADLHFGHKNVINFDHRPFSDVEEMDRIMISLWNGRVQPEDDVYIIGDFCYRSGKDPEWYLNQLMGKKHLILGNHDRAVTENENAKSLFASIHELQVIADQGEEICLCHYPLAEWYKSRHGSWHIYGHIHGNRDEVYDFMRTRERALNAAACINNYMPVSFKELVRNNKAFRRA